MAWYDRTGKRVGAIGDRRGHPRNIIRFSPSGKSAAFTRQGAMTQEVWIADVASGHPERLTDNGRSPVWSPDESEIAFLRQDESDKSDPPTYTIYRKKVDGSAAEVPVWSGAGIILINDWSGDGQYLLLTIFDTTKPGIALGCFRTRLSPSATHDPVRFETKGRGHAQFVPSKGPPLGITTDGVMVHGMPGTKPGPWQVGSENACHATVAQGRAGALLPRWRLPSGRRTSGTDHGLQVWAAATPVPATVRLPDRCRTVGAGMGRHARWAALPGHEPATRRASIDCDRHQLGRGVIEGRPPLGRTGEVLDRLAKGPARLAPSRSG